MQCSFFKLILINIDQILLEINFELWRSKGCKIMDPQSLQRLGIEPALPKDQVYNSEITKNVALNPKGLEFFLNANLDSL